MDQIEEVESIDFETIQEKRNDEQILLAKKLINVYFLISTNK